MNDRDGMDRLLRTWFAEDAVHPAPSRLAATVAESTHGRRQRPGWLAWLTSTGARIGGGARGRTGGLLLAFVLVTATLVVGGAIMSAGGSPAPLSRIYTSDTPWSFSQPAKGCGERTAARLPSGPLPEVGPPALAHPRNGMIAFGRDTLIDPVTLIDPLAGSLTATHLPGVPSIGVNAWSPDGRWLTLGSSDAYDEPACRDIYILSSDGRRLADLTTYADADLAAWSPDARWLAIASGMADRRAAIEVLAVGPDGSVADARRVWEGDPGSWGSLAWGRDGTLAWAYYIDDPTSSGLGLFVLRPGESDPQAIDLGGVDLGSPPRWSADGHELVALGKDVAGVRSIYVITPSDGSVRTLDVAVPPFDCRYTCDFELQTSSEGRVFYPARTAATLNVDIYAARLDGQDDRQLTSFPLQGPDVISSDAALSPDEVRVAFQMDGSARETPGIWVVDADGTMPARLLHATATSGGPISWQPVP